MHYIFNICVCVCVSLCLLQIGTLHDHYLFEIPHRQTRSAGPSRDHHAILSSHPKVINSLIAVIVFHLQSEIT